MIRRLIPDTLVRPREFYQLVLHVPTGERYAFRLQVPADRGAGCLGRRSLPQ